MSLRRHCHLQVEQSAISAAKACIDSHNSLSRSQAALKRAYSLVLIPIFNFSTCLVIVAGVSGAVMDPLSVSIAIVGLLTAAQYRQR